MKINCNFKPHLMVEVQFNPEYSKVDDLTFPKPRSGHRIIYSGKSIYSLGGYNPSLATDQYEDPVWEENCPLFKELWKFNILCNSWSRMKNVGDMPAELASHAAVSHDSHLIVFGGTSTPFGEASSNNTYVCNLKTGVWKKLLTTGRHPRPMYGQALCRKEDKLFVIGGTTGYQYFLDVHILDLATLTWSLLVPSLSKSLAHPEARYRHEIVEHNGYLYVFGGGTSEHSFPLDMLPTFNLEQQYWRLTTTHPDPRIKQYPKARKCHVLVRYKNSVYIQGGMSDKKNFKDFWRFDLTTMTWQKLRAITEKAVYFHSAAVTEEGCIYMFGGIWNDANTRTNKVFKIYVDVPSLLTMSWEAVLKCYPNLLNLDKSKLLKFGIPPTIVQLIT